MIHTKRFSVSCRPSPSVPSQAVTFVGVFFFVGLYIMLVSLMLATTGGKPWSSNSGRILLLAHGFLCVCPLLVVFGIIPNKYQVNPLMHFSMRAVKCTPHSWSRELGEDARKEIDRTYSD